MNSQTRNIASLWKTGAAGPNRSEEVAAPDASQPCDPKLRAIQNECARLERELEDLRSKQQILADRHAETLERSTMLATLFIVCERLHGCADRKEVLLTLREIIASVVGCEEYILYRVESDGWLFLEDSCGVDAKGSEIILPYCGHIGLAAQTGEPFWADEAGSRCSPLGESDLTACIPLKRNGVVTGALAIYRLLPQRGGIHELDRELFRVLETHLASALYCADAAKTQHLASGGVA